MDKNNATETAYRNGYADGFSAGKLAALPCRIGDKVFGLRRYGDQRLLKYGRVSQMYYDDEMNLVVCAHHVCRGIWGKDVFATEAEALEALAKRERRVG